MCLFKTLIGGWATTHRMHEPIKLNCIFGCRHEPDDIHHYVLCAPLWQIVGEVLSERSPFPLADRLCLDNSSSCAVHWHSNAIIMPRICSLVILLSLMYRTLGGFREQHLKVD